MRQAQSVKVLPADQQDRNVVDGRGGSRIRPAIEDGQLGDGVAGPVDTEHLLASARGALENANMAALDDIESGAGVALGEDQLSRSALTRHDTRCDEAHLGGYQVREDRDLGERLGEIRHARYFNAGFRRGSPELR